MKYARLLLLYPLAVIGALTVVIQADSWRHQIWPEGKIREAQAQCGDDVCKVRTCTLLEEFKRFPVPERIVALIKQDAPARLLFIYLSNMEDITHTCGPFPKHTV